MEHVIGLGGDIVLARSESTNRFRAIGLDETTFSFANLEAPLTDLSDEYRYARPWGGGGFKIDPAVVSELRPFSGLSVANNHAMDHGVEGYLASIQTLDDANVGHAGGGHDVGEARKALIKERDGLTVAFLAYTCLHMPDWEATESRPGMATIKVITEYENPERFIEQPGTAAIIRTFVDEASRQRVEREIASAKASADVVVVSIHWGVSQGNRHVFDYQKELGRACIDAGAEMVFGHHAHVLMPIELYKGKPICYSLGNVLFEWKELSIDNVGAFVRVYLKDKVLDRIGVVPIIWNAQTHDPERSEGESAERVAGILFPDPSVATVAWNAAASEFVVSVG